MTTGHVPVMLSEVLGCLQPKDHEIYVDATFGGGGYTRAFLEAAACQVIAFDRDPDAVVRAQTLKQAFGERLTIVQSPFGDIDNVLAKMGIHQVNGVVFDIGVSSFQIDTAERGFSLRYDGPLDMRMDPSQGVSARDVVNTFPEEEIANILYQFGDERKSRPIARAIVRMRDEKAFDTTFELANIVKKVVRQTSAEHPATRTFQALRIFVNDELGELKRGLESAKSVLAPGGRLVVVTFHSLEDRLVKEFLTPAKPQGSSRYMPEARVDTVASPFRLLHKKPLAPTKEEILQNPRARSAKLRAAYFEGGLE